MRADTKGFCMKLWEWLVKKDKQLNEIMGGDSDKTISWRLGKNIRKHNCWPCRIFCRTILLPLGFILNKSWKHCVDTYKPTEVKDDNA